MRILGQSWDDPQTAGIFALATGLMNNRPQDGIMAMLQAMGPEAQARRKMREMELRKGTLEMDDLERKQRDSEAARAELRDFYANNGIVGGLRSGAQDGPPSGAALPQSSGMPASGAPGAVAPKADLWGQYREIGNRMAARGLPDQAQQYYSLAEKFRPKYGTEPRVMMQDGKPVNVLVGEDGTTQVLPFGVKPNIKLQDLGGRVVALDENTASNGQTWDKTMTPGERASNALGWANYGNARDRLNFDKSQAGTAVTYQQDASGNIVALPNKVAPGTVPRATAVVAPGAGMQPLTGKPSEAVQKERLSLNQQRALIDSALDAVTKTPTAFSMGRGLATLGGTIAESAAGRMDSDAERQARAFVFNNVSSVINERAGAAQSAQELARLRSFLPAETDNADQIQSKFRAFRTYLDEKDRGTTSGAMPPRATPAAPAPGGLSADAIAAELRRRGVKQ